MCHGDAASPVPRSDLAAFWAEMDGGAAGWQFMSFTQVEHGFTTPPTPARTPNPADDSRADRQSRTALAGVIDDVAPSPA